MTNIPKQERAQILTEALPYIQEFYDKVVVIKYGGNAMINEERKQQVMEDIVLLSLVGIKVVLVHGGGPEITETLERMGKQTEFVNGLRVTDRETAQIVQMVLAGKINKTLVNLLQMHGGRAMGISGMDGHMIRAKMKNPALGYVGEITDVDIRPIKDLLEKGYIPVVSTVGCDEHGNAYNINADTAAAYIAGAMRAFRLISMTDIAGILQNRNDPSSLIPVITVEQAVHLFETGVISGGMIPKVECCIDAIHLGVERVVILDGRVPHALLLEMLTDEGVGTQVIPTPPCESNTCENKIE